MKYLYICLYGIALAFIIDILFGIKQFRINTVISIIITLLGIFILADVKLRIKKIQKELLLRIITEVALGYVAHYILKYWSNSVYILLVNLILVIIFSKKYTFKYNKDHKDIIKWVFLVQSLGFFVTYLGNYIATNSITLSQYVRPVSIIFTVIIAFLSKNEERKLKLKDIFAVSLVVTGLLML